MAEENKDSEIIQEPNTEASNADSSSSDENVINEDINLTEKNVDEFVKSNRNSLLKKVLLGLVALLVLVLLLGTALYFLGYFEPEKIIQDEIKPENKQEEIKEPATYNFDLKDINSKKLNQQLAYLTNKNLNQEKIDENEKIENEKKIIEEEKRRKEEALKAEEELLSKEKIILESKKEALEKQKDELELLKQEALSLKEEMINAKKELETKQETEEAILTQTNNLVPNDPIEEEIKENEFIQLINVAKIKGELYKSYLDKITAINTNILLCRDDKNIIEIYMGPFVDTQIRNDVLNQLVENGIKESYEVELTLEEFNKRCNY